MDNTEWTSPPEEHCPPACVTHEVGICSVWGVAAQHGRVKACSFTHASCGRPTYSRSLWSLAYDMECWGGLSSSTRVITRLEVFSRMAAWRPFRILPALISFTGWRWLLPYFYWSEELKDAWGSIVISDIRGSLSDNLKKNESELLSRDRCSILCMVYFVCAWNRTYLSKALSHTQSSQPVLVVSSSPCHQQKPREPMRATFWRMRREAERQNPEEDRRRVSRRRVFTKRIPFLKKLSYCFFP